MDDCGRWTGCEVGWEGSDDFRGEGWRMKGGVWGGLDGMADGVSCRVEGAGEEG